MLIFDLEADLRKQLINDIGAITISNHEFHSKSLNDFIRFIGQHKPSFFAAHNALAFDMKIVAKSPISNFITQDNIIDTLYLSALFFPKRPYHALVKDDKISSDYLNNPLNDSKKAKHVLADCVNQFHLLNDNIKLIFYNLLKDVVGVGAFFKYISFPGKTFRIENTIRAEFSQDICLNKNIKALIKKYPLELSFVLSLINTGEVGKSLLPGWVINRFSVVETILQYLRNSPCNKSNCEYCNRMLSAQDGLNLIFGYQSFRTFAGEPLQEMAVNSALRNESLIAVFPTGGGKSLTFQLPALISGENIGGLTIVISPLQSLMKDQVDNLHKKGITNVAFISGLLNNIERKDVIDRVLDGTVNILYLAPESLRSKTIENLLLKRQIVRFVIDEAHCFSTWGHDFRVDYLYIGEFIKNIQKKKNLKHAILVSCFTATAKKDVIKDISKYFYNKLNLKMKVFHTSRGRTNLDYHVIKVADDENRYLALRSLIEGNNCPIIVYASRVRAVEDIYRRLLADNFSVSKFHGQMETDDKIKNQNNFMNNHTKVIVATNAFGMGVDKDDVGVVIHYDISNSLENYVQEAGRAGRDDKVRAKCYILYNENDLDKHFQLLINTKINIQDINQIWSGIKEASHNANRIVKTPYEIGLLAGWNEASGSSETRIKTCILALEDAALIKRGLNSPRVYATSLLVTSVEEGNKIITNSSLYNSNEEQETSKRILSYLVSTKRKSWMDLAAQSRVDYIADQLGLQRYTVIDHINRLRELNILAFDDDMNANITKTARGFLIELNRYKEVYDYLLSVFTEVEKSYNLKVLNAEFKDREYKTDIKYLRNAINHLEITKQVKINKGYNENFSAQFVKEAQIIISEFEKYFNIARFLIEYLTNKHEQNKQSDSMVKVGFSAIEIKRKYETAMGLIKENITVKDIELVILMLQRLDIMTFEGGFLVVYSPYTIVRLEKNNYARYTKEHYQKLANHYKNKNQQIHIVGEYAELMDRDEAKAQEFVSDYFNLTYKEFIDKYFPGKLKKELDYKMSKSRFQKLFSKLSPEQMEVINDKSSKVIGVIAGPGSGKTKLLVNKLAAIIYNEDVRSNQLLMLTFSRNAAMEFKERLYNLIGSFAFYITITTFHSYAFDLLGKPGSLENSDTIVKEAVELIRNNEAELFKITKLMVVIDEAQDMSQDEFDLINELIRVNKDLRVLAVGDDDQNIYEFRHSSSEFLQKFAQQQSYELSLNFRSRKQIVAYSNMIIANNKDRIKQKEIVSNVKGDAIVRVSTYSNSPLIIPTVHQVIKDQLTGRTAIITRTNDEALLVQAYLRHCRVRSKLIWDLKGIKPYNIYEFRTFFEMLSQSTTSSINDEIWNKTFQLFNQRFSHSNNYESYSRVLSRFYTLYPNAYLSDLKEYLLEVDVNNFTSSNNLIVTNLHKVKGMQFDNVYLLYDYKGNLNEEAIRAIYVGLTRAKSFLHIHTNNDFFSKRKVKEVAYKIINKSFPEPRVLEIAYTLRDVHLDYYLQVRNELDYLQAGDVLTLDERYLLYNGRRVGRLSKEGYEQINTRKTSGYIIDTIEVHNLVYWYDKDEKHEVLVMLPKLKFALAN